MIATEQHEVPDAPLSPSDAQPKPVPPAAPPRQEASERARFRDAVGEAEQAECPGSAGALEYGGVTPASRYENWGGEIWERHADGRREMFAEDVIGRLDNLERELDNARAELCEYDHTFALRRDADMRAIDRWRKAHPGNELVWPDHADLVVWLMERTLELETRCDKAVRSEKELGASYIRIREIVEAWHTDLGGENRFEVTEEAVGWYVNRAAELGQRLASIQSAYGAFFAEAHGRGMCGHTKPDKSCPCCVATDNLHEAIMGQTT